MRIKYAGCFIIIVLISLFAQVVFAETTSVPLTQVESKGRVDLLTKDYSQMSEIISNDKVLVVVLRNGFVRTFDIESKKLLCDKYAGLENLYKVIFDGKQFVAVAGETIYRSDDGIDWIKVDYKFDKNFNVVSDLGSKPYFCDILFNDNKYILSLGDQGIAVSDDLVNFRLVFEGSAGTFIGNINVDVSGKYYTYASASSAKNGDMVFQSKIISIDGVNWSIEETRTSDFVESDYVGALIDKSSYEITSTVELRIDQKKYNLTGAKSSIIAIYKGSKYICCLDDLGNIYEIKKIKSGYNLYMLSKGSGIHLNAVLTTKKGLFAYSQRNIFVINNQNKLSTFYEEKNYIDKNGLNIYVSGDKYVGVNSKGERFYSKDLIKWEKQKVDDQEVGGKLFFFAEKDKSILDVNCKGNTRKIKLGALKYFVPAGLTGFDFYYTNKVYIMKLTFEKYDKDIGDISKKVVFYTSKTGYEWQFKSKIDIESYEIPNFFTDGTTNILKCDRKIIVSKDLITWSSIEFKTLLGYDDNLFYNVNVFKFKDKYMLTFERGAQSNILIKSSKDGLTWDTEFDTGMNGLDLKLYIVNNIAFFTFYGSNDIYIMRDFKTIEKLGFEDLHLDSRVKIREIYSMDGVYYAMADYDSHDYQIVLLKLNI